MMVKAAVQKILIVGMFVCAVSCATRGKNFPTDVSWIKPQVTKRSDVTTILGEPFQVGFASGKPTWTYGFYRYRLFGNSNTKELKFYWNPDGSVGNFSFTSSFPEDVKKGAIMNKNAPVDDLH